MSQELSAALEAWRADRSNIELANVVDDESARLDVETPPKQKMHRWWTTRARAYDPVTVTSLLASLRWQARGKNVSWRTIILRDTPLVAHLREYGRADLDAKVHVDWLNLIDRIGLMLTWPDDPRVAMALAALVHEPPVARDSAYTMRRRLHDAALVSAIVQRVCAIGDLRAIELVGSVRAIDEAASARLAATVKAAPLPGASPTADAKLDGLWSAVIEEPASIERRLILADALGERGDPRGEVIALQCAPLVAIEKARAAGEAFDPSGMFGAHADKIGDAIRANWHRWLGEVALVVERSARWSGGLLADITVGKRSTPPWAWERITDHRELCAINRVYPSRELSPVIYLRFVTALARKPRWVFLGEGELRELRTMKRAALPGVMLPMPSLDDVRRVLAVSPELERLDLGSVEPDQLATVAQLVATLRVPSVRLTVERAGGADRGLLAELRLMPNVFVRTYGEV